eukprot:scaffold17.g468.t1
MQLKQISRVLVQFSPLQGNARSAREFLARVTSKPAAASNPDCTVETRVRVKGEPFVEVQYENKQVERIATAHLTISQVIEQVMSRAEEMETGQKLKGAGLQNDKIASGWGGAAGREAEAGSVQFIPRQA